MRQSLVAISLLLCASLAQGAEPLRVFVSVLPQQTFVERIGGSHVVVESMVRPGFSPHTYEPTPGQVARLTEADLYVRIGMPFEDAWMERLRAANPTMRILDARDGITLREMAAHDHDDEAGDEGHTHASDHDQAHDHDHDHDHAHDHDADSTAQDHVATELDPHIWTSPVLVKQMVGNLRETLTELDPAHAQDYAANLTAFSAELDALDRDIRADLANLTQRRFMVFHPAWGYFAKTYGLTQIPIEKAGKEPGPRSLTALIDQARREQVRVIFVQPQFPRKAAEQVARAINGRVEVIDPLAPDYVQNLRQVARVIASSEP